MRMHNLSRICVTLLIVFSLLIGNASAACSGCTICGSSYNCGASDGFCPNEVQAGICTDECGACCDPNCGSCACSVGCFGYVWNPGTCGGSSCVRDDCRSRDTAAADDGDTPAATGTCTYGNIGRCTWGCETNTSKNTVQERCVGTCGTGTNSCKFREHVVSNANGAYASESCGDKDYDADTNQNTCNACTAAIGIPRWSIGGEVAAASCCGDDNGEFKIMLLCDPSSGCVSDLSDDACCNSALDCAYNSQCYSSGWIGCAPWNSDLKVRCSTTSTVWYLEENCVNKLSSDSDGGDKPLVAGICKDYGACVGSDCLSADYADICIDPVTLREYYSIQGDPASELGCPNKLYGCASFEQAATDTDAGDDPDNDGLCTGGVSAGCQGNAFVTPAGQSGTDQCYGSCSAGSGNDRCKWREYYPADSTDSCPAADTCATHDYDVDNSQHVCEGCSLNWVASGESPSGPGEYNFPGEIACCGDDAGENYINNEGMEGCCALPQGQSCFWSDACHTGWQAGGHEACVQGIDGLCTDSSGVDPGSSCYDDIDNDCDNTKDFGSIASSFNGADTDCMGRLKGRITNLGGIALSGVTVTVVSKIEYAGVFTTFDVTTETDADGNYEFNNNLPGNLRYDIVASKPGYEDAKLGNVFLPFRSENTADLQLRFVSLCEPDCSFASDAICHAECEGINGCSFYDLTAKTVCDGVHTDFDRQYNATHKVSCCKGAPYLPSDIKAVVEIQGAKNIVNIVRNVWYDGRFVKMVISVFR